MADKYKGVNTTSSSFMTKTLPHIIGAITVGLFLVSMIWSFSLNPYVAHLTVAVKSTVKLVSSDGGVDISNTSFIDIGQETFYDDPKFGYWIETPIKKWDEKRQEWLKNHPSHAVGASDRILIVTGSHPSPCQNPIGDHLQLRLFKNKVDYSRINGYEIFYNNDVLHPKMPGFWAKVSVIKAAMLAHPETEWIWWVDSDAVFTDMDFNPPMKRYKDYNLIVGGNPKLVYDNPSWLGLNAGVFYIRNCQWSMDFLEEWAKMGPQTPDYNKWGQILAENIKDKANDPTSDDQTAMVYLLLKNEKIRKKVFLEHEQCIQGHWEFLVKTLNSITKNYEDLENKEGKLRRRHAEIVQKVYSHLWELHLDHAGYKNDAGKRPCITHFAGCQPCSGKHNPNYKGDSCWKGLERTLNFADNQVLRNYGFVHLDLSNSYLVSTI